MEPCRGQARRQPRKSDKAVPILCDPCIGRDQSCIQDMAQTAVLGSSLGDNCPTYIYKVVLLGSTSVGKSSLAYRYVKNDFKESLPTVGCSFFTQTVQLETATIKLEIWDTAGQEKYHSVCHLYYRGAHAALLVYDLTNKETLNRVKQWLTELEKEFLPDEIVIALVGNKTDLADEREVAAEEGEEFARNRSLLFMETSAKSNHQVNDIFMAIAQELLRREGEKAAVPSTGGGQRLDLGTRRARMGCCRI
ncbi:ras-related protein Rab-17 isoform X1 [Cyrtonyx montezumae]|uniref:ras-related protein Rab-17 isoform X1 n=2 Tax=Cyrtonyx montezumae TaxID=9017 RepID=UPI0032D9E00F